MNDLFDLTNDRAHIRKRHRPLASGAIPILHAVVLVPLLLALAIALGLATSAPFLGVLGLYFLVTTAYSMVLKRLVLIDVMTLSILYSLRIFAGSVAVGVPISPWLMALSVFLFLCLALVKRNTELVAWAREGKDSARGRGYRVSDIPMLGALGAAAGYGAVLVLALYINSTEVHALYGRPHFLWLVCLLLLYWISRLLLMAHRGDMHDDPVVFAVKDRTSLVTGAIVVTIALISR